MDDFERRFWGDAEATEEFAVSLYEELRQLARRELAGERVDHTLQPTALVHEAYLRLVGSEGGDFDGRGHFYVSAARAIRRVLVDHARNRGREKRGGHVRRVVLEEEPAARPRDDVQLLALDEALERLARLSPQKARVIELRFFVGLTLDESAAALGLSPSSVARDWRMARAWLQAELDEDARDGS